MIYFTKIIENYVSVNYYNDGGIYILTKFSVQKISIVIKLGLTNTTHLHTYVLYTHKYTPTHILYVLYIFANSVFDKCLCIA